MSLILTAQKRTDRKDVPHEIHCTNHPRPILRNDWCWKIHRSPLLSFRTVEAKDYRAALLLFYEQNNLSAFKKMFLEQVEFAMKEYF